MPFIALMPQWDFLDFLAVRRRSFRPSAIRMQAEVTGSDRATAASPACAPQRPKARSRSAPIARRLRRPELDHARRAGLAVEDSARRSTCSGFASAASRREDSAPAGSRRHIVVSSTAATTGSAPIVIPKGGVEDAAGRRSRCSASGGRDHAVLRRRIGEIGTWSDVKLLTVAVDRLLDWSKPGLLCIGDAAHAMSPVGGVGINLAVQDAVAAANELATPLREGRVTRDMLAAIQQRRSLPMRLIQRIQVVVQNMLLAPALASTARPTVPFSG